MKKIQILHKTPQVFTDKHLFSQGIYVYLQYLGTAVPSTGQ